MAPHLYVRTAHLARFLHEKQAVWQRARYTGRMKVRELSVAPRPAEFLGLSPYHWLVIAAAWNGWGFDLFDALLFNFVAPNCMTADEASGSGQ